MIDYLDKKVALVILNTEKEDDAHVYLGIIESVDDNLFFRNKAKDWNISLDEEKLDRLKPVTTDLKETLLGADLFFSLSVSGIPEDTSDNFTFTGIKWH